MALATVQLLPWHGRHLAVRRAGTGPSIVFIHGMAGSLTTWDPVFEGLAKNHDVIAVDLPGHGESSRLRGDYSLGSLAAAVRDVLDELEVTTATVVGHSLGGGIAMQFMYQFPERCERLILVSAGGLGREVTPMLRALTIPGAGLALAGGAHLQGQRHLAAAGRVVRPLARRVWNDLPYMLRQMSTLDDPETRRSFLATINAVIDVGGQGINATERLHLAAGLPTLIVWGDKDRMIPISHGRAAAEAVPHSRFEPIAGAGHYPHEDNPDLFASLVADFMATTDPRT
ncbi:alpha/beta fold hydrolase [Nocardioides sp.]|uniref:alpha/beta fold hydrolase n=1 Tax=Nocardioides sp. TaxID=35761 RepID=UPI003568CA30